MTTDCTARQKTKKKKKSVNVTELRSRRCSTLFFSSPSFSFFQCVRAAIFLYRLLTRHGARERWRVSKVVDFLRPSDATTRRRLIFIRETFIPMESIEKKEKKLVAFSRVKVKRLPFSWAFKRRFFWSLLKTNKKPLFLDFWLIRHVKHSRSIVTTIIFTLQRDKLNHLLEVNTGACVWGYNRKPK